MDRPTKQNVAVLIGLVLILIGVTAPSGGVIEFVRGTSLQDIPAQSTGKLLQGAMWFKGGLILLGLAVIGLFKVVAHNGADTIGRIEAEQVQRPRIAVVAAILLVGIVLRVHGLDQGLWYDEITAYVKYVRMPIGTLLTTYDSENQHFLYTLFAHACIAWFGDSSWAVRVPAVIFGVGSLLGVYLVGRQLLSELEALLATALLVFSYHHIWFSQNARGYTGVMFFAMMATWAFLRGLRENTVTWWCWYAVAAAAGVFVHVTMAFVIASHLLIYCARLLSSQNWRHRVAWRGMLYGFVMGGLLTFQLHALVMPQILSQIGQKTNVQAWNNPFWTVIEMVRGIQVGVKGGLAVLAAALMLFGFGVWKMGRTSGLMLALLLLPAALGTAVVLGIGHPLWPRFFFFLSGFVALVVVHGVMILAASISKMLKMSHAKGLVLGTGLSLMVILGSAVSVPAVYAPKQDYRSALGYVERNRTPEDAVVAVGLAQFPYKQFFETNWTTAETLEELNAIRARTNRTWVVMTMPMHLEAYAPDIWSSLQSEFLLQTVFPGTLGDGAVYVYRVDRKVASIADAQESSRR
ncbi:MAG: hypothetical protein OJF47_003728 [Nitrospira sp.]|jgi:hypothetical protein|nr:MAG: hypothetical protein OJF47_003728 [Nitrospira sp.]